MTVHEPDSRVVRIAVVGAGYWGPNLVRNFSNTPDCEVLWVCDQSVERAERVVGRHSTIHATQSLDTVLNDDRVDAVAIATPTATHFPIANSCLGAGKHVLLEKPLAGTVEEGRLLVELAEERGLVLMCDHTYCYTPAVRHIRDLLQYGQLGDLQYLDSVRINLGLIQPDVDVFWDLAPHDLSILDFVLPNAFHPRAVAAQGADPIGAGKACIGYLTLPLQAGAIAHLHVNWLSPTKIRQTIIGGSRRMVVWDDLNPSQRVAMYDKGVQMAPRLAEEERRSSLVSYRVGDMVAPALPEGEALRGVTTELCAAIREGREPLTDGHSGLRVLTILEAASRSLAAGGVTVNLEPDPVQVAVAI